MRHDVFALNVLHSLARLPFANAFDGKTSEGPLSVDNGISLGVEILEVAVHIRKCLRNSFAMKLGFQQLLKNVELRFHSKVFQQDCTVWPP